MFHTTHWSMVIQTRAASQQGRVALETLCCAYRSPVLSYLRAHGCSPADAEDLTQAFFEQMLLHRFHTAADPTRGRFRTFLLTALKRFLANQHDRERTLKRGGHLVFVTLEDQHEPDDVAASTPEQAFEREYALTVISRALERLRKEAEESGKSRLFDQLSGFLLEPADRREYSDLAERLGLRRNTLAVAIHRLRNRLREMVRAELVDTVDSPAALEDEMNALSSALAAPAAVPGMLPGEART